MKFVLTFVFLSIFTMFSFGQMSQENFPSDWTLYNNFDGIKVEYKYQPCDSGNVKNQVLVLFRYTNTSSAPLSMSWTTKEFRNGDCYNCHYIDSYELVRDISLSAGEVLEADGTSKEDKNIYLFSNFINLVNGRRDTKLTSFEFINVEVSSN